MEEPRQPALYDADDAYSPEALELLNVAHEHIASIFSIGLMRGLRIRDIGALIHAATEEQVCEKILTKRAGLCSTAVSAADS